MARDNFSTSTKDRVGKQAGLLCSNPDCQAATTGAKRGEDGVLNLGEACHITAAAPGGARYDSSLTPAERQDHRNGIWLCKVCARAIDSDAKQFTVEILRQWKAAAQTRSWQLAVNHVAPFGSMGSGGDRVGGAASAVPDIDSTAARLAAAAQADIESFKTEGRWPKHPISLTLRLHRPPDSAPFDAAGLATALASFDEIAVIAPPGTGKSTTLIQVANALAEQGVSVPVFVPLAEWSRQNGSLRDAALTKRSFRAAGATQAELDLLASEGRLTLLLDGWNEIDVASQARLRTELEVLRRENPDLKIVISTRLQALAVPLNGPTLVDVDPLSDDQQLEIARAVRGDDGAALLDSAWRTPGVRDLVGIPFYLDTLLDQMPGAALPGTKEEVLRIFVERHAQAPVRAAALRASLFGRHDDFLVALAVDATATANTTIEEAKARTIIADVERRLVAAGQINKPPEPMDVVDFLVSRHSLVRHGDQSSSVAFQHQQIQEWYASHEVERVMRAAATGDPAAVVRLAVEILDDREWEEAAFFATERLSRSGDAGADAVGIAILSALEIDPILAAEMIFRSAHAVWDRIAAKVMKYAARWHVDGKVDRAVGFMIRTGRPEFALTVRALVGNPDSQVHFEALRAAPRFRSSVLGPDAEVWISALPKELRKSVVSEIAMSGDISSMEFATKIAKADPSPTVRFGAVQSLAFRRADRLAAQILTDCPAEVWEEVGRRGFPERSSVPAIDARIRAARDKFAAEATDPLSKLRVFAHQKISGSRPAEDITRLLSNADFPVRDQNAPHIVHATYKMFPDAVVAGFVARLEAGLEIPFRCEDQLRASAVEFEAGPIAEAVLNPVTPHRLAMSCASLVGPTVVRLLVDEWLKLGVKLRNSGPRPAKEMVDRHGSLLELISSTRLSAFTQTLLTKAEVRDPVTIAGLADLYDRHGGREEGRRTPPSETERPRIVAALQSWAEALLTDPSSTRYHLAELTRAFGRLADPELLPVLERILVKDLAGQREQQGRPGVRMLYTKQFSRAFSAIGATAAADVMVSYLRDVDFGLEAAFVLKEIWDRDHGVTRPSGVPRWPNFAAAAVRRVEREAAQVTATDAPYAAEIFKAISDLIAEGSEAQRRLAVGLARVGFALPHADHTVDLNTLFGFPDLRGEKLVLLLTLVNEGYVVPAHLSLWGIRDFLETAKSRTWMLRENHYELDQWLSLLPFSDCPAAIGEALDLMPAEARHPGQLHQLLSALGRAPSPDAERVLLALPERDPDFLREYEWLAAVEARSTPSAIRYLFDLADRGELVALGGGGIGSIPRTIAAIMRNRPEVRTEVYAAAERRAPSPARNLAVAAIMNEPDEQGFMLLLRLYAAEGRPFDGGLREALRRLALNEEESAQWVGAKELVSVTLASLRKVLFEMTADVPAFASLASAALTEIDAFRDEYGAPEAERRHPDIASGRPWPLAVRQSV